MPLSFRSENQGNVAFGFFNIESDMLLLENYFFFADRFCEKIIEIAKTDIKSARFNFPVYRIERPDDIGDLAGAIHGIRFTGFIGTLYRIFPFPDRAEDFKQNPDGFKTKKIVAEQIRSFSTPADICLDFSKQNQVWIGPYIFDTSVFHDLIIYIWQGGYPGWKDEQRPDYVLAMKKALETSRNRFFQGKF